MIEDGEQKCDCDYSWKGKSCNTPFCKDFDRCTEVENGDPHGKCLTNEDETVQYCKCSDEWTGLGLCFDFKRLFQIFGFLNF